MDNYIKSIEQYWQIRDSLSKDTKEFIDAKKAVDYIINQLENGNISICKKQDSAWSVNQWIKKAILLSFITSEMKIYDGNCLKWYDKIDLKFADQDDKVIKESGIRVLPGAFIRKGSYIGKNSVIMPSFVNIGAYISESTLIDSWANVGSCAYVGKNCHISTGVSIGGVLEPLQANPVIIEDNCFVGAGSQIVEGVIIGEGSVIGMGVSIGASTKIVDRKTGEITYGKIPPYSVVVSGSLPSEDKNLPSLYCAVIIKQVDKKTRDKTNINELLRIL